jgi:hypothetical protein
MLAMKLNIQKLMVLGILYTSSDSQQRATKFFELLQPSLEDHIDVGDEDFLKYFPFLGKLCFDFIIRHYNQTIP